MAFYVIKEGGTATGDAGREATQPTGSFAARGVSAYYDSVFDVCKTGQVPTTAVQGGDTLVVSDAHDLDHGGQVDYEFASTKELRLVSVSDSNMDQESNGAEEGNAGNDLCNFRERVWCRGFTWKLGGDLVSTAANGRMTLDDCTINLLAAASDIRSSNDGAQWIWNDVTVNVTTPGSSISIDRGSSLDWVGGSIGATDDLFVGSGNAGGRANLRGVDVSAVTDWILGAYGNNASADDMVRIVLDRCPIGGSVGMSQETFANSSLMLLLTHCASTAAAAEYAYYKETWGGDVETQDDAGVHRAESVAFPGGEKVSFRMTTNSDCSPQVPLTFDAPEEYIDLSSASTDTVRVYFTSTTALTDQNFWAELLYPDGTNKHISTYLSTRSTDILATGTAHTTDSGSDWRDGGSPLATGTEYYLDIDTSGDVGAAGVPTLRLSAGVASAVIYIDTTIEAVA